jgi:hypothetical protein
MRTIAVAILLLASVALAVAQTAAPKKGDAPKTREELMQRVLQTALANITKVACSEGKACAPETEAEKKNPPLSLSETSQVFGRGIFSGGASYCGLNWQARNFEPMMAYWRTEKKKNDRQLALIALIHGIAKDRIVAEFWGQGKCPDEIRKDLETKLDFKPQG